MRVPTEVSYGKGNMLCFVNSLTCVLTFKLILRNQVVQLEYMGALSS
jgi:hypothetical protein